jgi:hypothetical protein
MKSGNDKTSAAELCRRTTQRRLPRQRKPESPSQRYTETSPPAWMCEAPVPSNPPRPVNGIRHLAVTRSPAPPHPHKIEQFRRYLVLPGKMSASMQLSELFCHVAMRGVHSGETSRVLGRDGFDHSFGQARRNIFSGEFFEKHAGGEVVKWRLFPSVGGKSRQIER